MMKGAHCVFGWMWVALAPIAACHADPCKGARPTVHLDLVLEGVTATEVRSLEILLDSGEDHFRRVYNLADQLADGRTSLSIEIVPPPPSEFELTFDVRGFDAPDATGAVVASRVLTMVAEPNGCNEAELTLSPLPGRDAGVDAGVPTKDGGSPDGMTDAGRADEDGGSPDAETADGAEPDASVDTGVDAGCPDDDSDGVCNADDNCPFTFNPGQEDSDGVAAFPIPFAPVAVNGGVPVPGWTEDDDSVSIPIPLTFDFQFFGVTRTQIRVSTNGFFTFSQTQDDGCCEGQAIPDSSTPNELVALAWSDLEVPGYQADQVRFQVDGVPPERRFVLLFDLVNVCCGTNEPPVNVEAILFEGSNRIEIHTFEQPPNDGFTRGIESANGARAAYLPGEAAAGFALSEDAVAFTTGPLPDGIGDACANAH